MWLNLHVMGPRHKLLLWFLVASETLAYGQTRKREVTDPAALTFIDQMRAIRSHREVESSARPQEPGGKESPSKAPEPESLALTPTPSTSPAPFLMRWHFDHTLGGFDHMKVEDTCIVVYPSGRFRMEKSTRNKGEKLRIRVVENSLNENELHQLRELLDDPMLKASTHQRFGTGYPHEQELTALSVPRGERIQHLSFATYFGFDTKYIGAGIDPDERLVAPLQKWLKSHIEAGKLEALPHASATGCIPPP